MPQHWLPGIIIIILISLFPCMLVYVAATPVVPNLALFIRRTREKDKVKALRGKDKVLFLHKTTI
jgi:hypothetical protein